MNTSIHSFNLIQGPTAYQILSYAEYIGYNGG